MKVLPLISSLCFSIIAITSHAETATQAELQRLSNALGFQQQLEHQKASILARDAAEMAQLFDDESATKAYLQVLSSQFNQDDVVVLTQFLESDVGRRFVAANQELWSVWAPQVERSFDQRVLLELEDNAAEFLSRAENYEYR